jgi:hypothetical protein
VNVKLKKILKSCLIAALGAVGATLLDPNIDWGDTAQWIVGACTVGARIIMLFVGAAAVRKVGVLALLALPLVSSTQAQNLAADWSWGPTLPMYIIRLEPDGSRNSFLDAGAGISINRNFFPNDSGSVKQLTIALPILMNASGGDAGNYVLTMGLTVGTLNNLFAFGGAVEVVNAVEGLPPAGLADGFQREDFAFIVSFGINLGGGKPASMARMAGAVGAGQASHLGPPPNYARLW